MDSPNPAVIEYMKVAIDQRVSAASNLHDRQVSEENRRFASLSTMNKFMEDEIRALNAVYDARIAILEAQMSLEVELAEEAHRYINALGEV